MHKRITSSYKKHNHSKSSRSRQVNNSLHINPGKTIKIIVLPKYKLQITKDKSPRNSGSCSPLQP